MNSPFNVRNPNIRAMPNQMNLSTNNTLDDPRKLQALLLEHKLQQEDIMSTVQDPTKLMAQMMEQSGPAPTTALGKGFGDIGRDWSAGFVYRKAKEKEDEAKLMAKADQKELLKKLQA